VVYPRRLLKQPVYRGRLRRLLACNEKLRNRRLPSKLLSELPKRLVSKKKLKIGLPWNALLRNPVQGWRRKRQLQRLQRQHDWKWRLKSGAFKEKLVIKHVHKMSRESIALCRKTPLQGRVRRKQGRRQNEKMSRLS
jgi:hypothetical protein